MPNRFESFADIEQLLGVHSAATKRHTHSLDHMHELLEFLGNPHKQFKVVHVAGTSGKTSTAYYIAALLQQAGKQVGLTVSPHVAGVNERVQIDLIPLPEGEFCRQFSIFYEAIKNCRVTPNYFELFTAFAFWEFAARRVDYAVVEVGVGGLLDSTNIFDDPRKLCVITDIGYDHMRVLGDTLEEIAAQKAGIVQLHNTVFCYQQGPEVAEVIRATSQKKQADLHILRQHDLGDDFEFLPAFQRRNFGLALEVVNFMLERRGEPSLRKGKILRAAYAHIPGRMETFKLGSKTVILDIAHNSQKLHALLASVREKYPGRQVAALLRMPLRESSQQRTEASIKEVVRGLDHIIFTSMSESGAADDDSFKPEELIRMCQESGFHSLEIVSDPRQAFDVLRVRHEPVLLVTGSTFILNHIRPLLVAGSD